MKRFAFLALLACSALVGCHSEESKYYAGGVSTNPSNYFTFDINGNRATFHNHYNGYSEIYLRDEDGYCTKGYYEKHCLSFANEDDVIEWEGSVKTDGTIDKVDFTNRAKTIHYIKAN